MALIRLNSHVRFLGVVALVCIVWISLIIYKNFFYHRSLYEKYFPSYNKADLKYRRSYHNRWRNQDSSNYGYTYLEDDY
ncbi:hypothetical protein SNEBB_006139 [Seison nebaliae]|nr:hypothetical protein SNEBB_006139 [Seison nebaliae]